MPHAGGENAHRQFPEKKNRSNCFIAQGCDAAYLTNLHTEFASHADYAKGEDRRNWDKEFVIRHYAGAVTYR